MKLNKHEQEGNQILSVALSEFYEKWTPEQRATAVLAVLDILQIRFEDDEGEGLLEQLSINRYLDLFDLQSARYEVRMFSALSRTVNEAEYAIPSNEYNLKSAKLRIKRHKKQMKKADDEDAGNFVASWEAAKERGKGAKE